MILEKVIDTTVNVRNPINFCADMDRHLMSELRNTFVGRCYKGAYVVGIKQILRFSKCHLSSTNTSGEGRVDVQFLAEVVVFSRWDILVGVAIASHQQMVVGTYEAAPLPEPGVLALRSARPGRAVVSLLATKAVETIAVGQKIAVRVVMAQHQPMQPQASVVGTLLVCDQAAPVYRLRGSLDSAAAVELAPVLEAIDAELEAREALVEERKADLWFFELLLYSYRSAAGSAAMPDQSIPTGAEGDEGSTPAWEGPAGLAAVDEGAELKNVLDIARRAVAGESVPVAGYWSRPLSLYRSSPLAASADAPPATWLASTDGAPRAVFAEFLKNILDFLAATREMVELYNTRELIDSHRNLWAVMRSAQKPIAS